MKYSSYLLVLVTSSSTDSSLLFPYELGSSFNDNPCFHSFLLLVLYNSVDHKFEYIMKNSLYLMRAKAETVIMQITQIKSVVAPADPATIGIKISPF